MPKDLVDVKESFSSDETDPTPRTDPKHKDPAAREAEVKSPIPSPSETPDSKK